jgi:hypothetical protein
MIEELETAWETDRLTRAALESAEFPIEDFGL